MAAAGSNALTAHVLDVLTDRLDIVTRSFSQALVINAGEGEVVEALRARGTSVDTTDYGKRFAEAVEGRQCDEDRLDLPYAAYDLIIAPSGLDTINDLPGALILARRALRSDGLFLACFPGAPSLSTLRRAIAVADAQASIGVARLHPQIDVRSAGNLLVRAGFALPVADVETLNLSYRTLDALIADIRASGSTNVLSLRRPVTRRWLTTARTAFAALADPDGRVREVVSLIVLTGWAPGPKQPIPARRGSATTSLADALPRAPAVPSAKHD